MTSKEEFIRRIERNDGRCISTASTTRKQCRNQAITDVEGWPYYCSTHLALTKQWALIEQSGREGRHPMRPNPVTCFGCADDIDLDNDEYVELTFRKPSGDHGVKEHLTCWQHEVVVLADHSHLVPP